MKIFRYFIFAAVICITGCSSSVRFTGEDRGGHNRKTHTEKTNPVSKRNNERNTLPDYETTNETILESKTGVASYYHGKFDGRVTASGEIYNQNDLTAAHISYPFNTIVRVTNLSNNRTVKVRINDRKPEMNGRLIDLSYAAAKELDIITNGIAEVKVDVISWGSDNK
jgi:rare lipoprotein A